jgi:hypothetical protein
MANYFFNNISKEERQNILDKHKTVYDGFVTEYGQSINNQPLYVQDFANDKGGITVSNKGVVKNYTNMNINENYESLSDMNEEDEDGDNWVKELMGKKEKKEEYDYVDESDLDLDEDENEVVNKINESIDMFRRFRKYN